VEGAQVGLQPGPNGRDEMVAVNEATVGALMMMMVGTYTASEERVSVCLPAAYALVSASF
jgi:hypothetical protein